jgi:hypothetical protein
MDIATDAALNFRRSIGTLPQRLIKTYANMKAIFGGSIPEDPEDIQAVINELANKAAGETLVG